ncbi:hypothetical protein OS493_033897 [Desmophyllum pertusum]|uniref:Uncharacterized protein n=1 Tax=Desmophyllum pertusum TaxID=174260 RepID=A0A9X0CCI5_9CNID|nr:hypothetical protein OS493_033897 [Desmophyllum pertusum]
MEAFCEKHAPGLFQQVYSSILNESKETPTAKRKELQRVRTVAIMHSMSFYRNQKICPMQKANGLNLKMCGASYNSLMSGMVLGYSCHPKTLQNYERALAEANKKEVKKRIVEATAKKQFLLLIEDDIHFIHTSHHPTTSQTSTAWHMCTGLLDVQEKMPAVSTPSDLTKLHRRVLVTMKNGAVKQCRGGADIQSVLEYFDSTLREFFVSSYLGTLSAEHRRVDMSNVKQSCENLRVYSDEARHDLELLSTTWLLDEFQQSLKSVADYRAALSHLLNEAPELKDYLRQFLVVLSGDFPTWKYNKKIIAEVC